MIRARDLNVIFIAGPGHGAPGVVANTWLEGSYSELYPAVSQDADGMLRLFRQFSFPGGMPSHAAPETPGSIHEGGELGYSLSHAFGAAFDNPDLLVACVIGDGEAETGPLATSWHGNKFLNPATDGAVLPILHLNGYKIANPTILARIEPRRAARLPARQRLAPIYVEGDEPAVMHQLMAAALDQAADVDRRDPAARARRRRADGRAAALADDRAALAEGLDLPEGGGRAETEGTWRAHQVPIADTSSPAHLALLEHWMRSLPAGRIVRRGGPADRRTSPAWRPQGARRMGANPHTNGGVVRPLRMPDFAAHAVAVKSPGAVDGEATHVMGEFLRDVMARNRDRAISACSVRTRPRPTACRRCSKSPIAPGSRGTSRATTTCRPMAA